MNYLSLRLGSTAEQVIEIYAHHVANILLARPCLVFMWPDVMLEGVV